MPRAWRRISGPLMIPHMECWSPKPKEDMDFSKPVQRRVMGMIKGVKDLLYEGRQREQGLSILERTELCGDLLADFQYLKRPYRKAGDGLLTRVWRDML